MHSNYQQGGINFMMLDAPICLCPVEYTVNIRYRGLSFKPLSCTLSLILSETWSGSQEEDKAEKVAGSRTAGLPLTRLQITWVSWIHPASNSWEEIYW